MASYDALAPYEMFIQQAAKKYNVDPQLIRNVIMRESSGNANAESGTGPAGLGQISQALAKQYNYSLQDRFDPEKNIDMTAHYLSDNSKAFGGDTQKTLVGYNLGTAGAKQYFSGKKDYGSAPQQYLNSPYYSDYNTGNGANPVAGLPGKTNSLHGEALLTATPQTEQQATDLASKGALMGSDALTAQGTIKDESEAERQQRELRELRENREQLNKLHNDQQAQANANRELLYSQAVNGLIAMLGSTDNRSTESHTVQTQFYKPQWGAPTEESLNTIGAFGTRSALMSV
ncbi:lytic transglycosylase domain-containing protein [Escherichia coli]